MGVDGATADRCRSKNLGIDGVGIDGVAAEVIADLLHGTVLGHPDGYEYGVFPPR